jgi:uncharacterized protein with ATP-grasp and redox domains
MMLAEYPDFIDWMSFCEESIDEEFVYHVHTRRLLAGNEYQMTIQYLIDNCGEQFVSTTVHS